MCSTPILDRAEPCAACGKEPATNYLTEIINGQQTNIVLCAACLRSRFQETGGFELPSIKGAQCYYCGGTPISASMNQAWEIASRKQPFHWTCFRCSQLYAELFTQALATVPQSLAPEKKMEAIQRIVGEVDVQVRASVASPSTD